MTKPKPAITAPSPDSLLDRLAARLRVLPPESLARFAVLVDDAETGPQTHPPGRAPGHLRPSSLWVRRKAAAKDPARHESLLSLLEVAGAHGLTDPELVDAMGLPLQTVSPLRGGLFKSGLVVHSNRYRQNQYGHACAVWVLASLADATCQAPREGWIPTIGQRAVLGILANHPEGLTDKEGAAAGGLEPVRYQQDRSKLTAWRLIEWTGEKVGRAYRWKLSGEGEQA